MLVQALQAKLAIERFDEGIVRGLPGTAEIQLHLVEVRSPVQRLRHELQTIVHPERFWLSPLSRDVLQDLDHVFSPEAFRGAQRQALTATCSISGSVRD